MAEKNIERAHAKWAKLRGWKVKKVTGDVGTLDRIYMKGGVTVWIEWKQPGGKLSKPQEVEMQDLWDHGIPAIDCDNIDDGKAWLNSHDPEIGTASAG